MRVIIAGGRDFNNYEMLCHCIQLLYDPREISVVSGGASGADSLAIKFALDTKVPLTIEKAKWDEFGKSAGYRRNVEMANQADALVAFWDGKSKGTKHMIDIAKSKNLKVNVFSYTGDVLYDDSI